MSVGIDIDTERDLIAWRNDTHSQFGEDGILEELFERLGIREGWFVEFGAWDGKHLSNTHTLYEKGWRGVCIEGDEKRFRSLEKTYGNDDRVVPINAWVGHEGESRLDAILQQTPVPKQFDLLSIDIDSDDYHVWNALERYEPTIVVVETNYTFPYNVDFVQNLGAYIGSSALAMTRLAISKGYTLVCYNIANGIYVRNDVASKLAIPHRSFAYLFQVGRFSSAGGYFASEFGGRWHFLYDENVAWGMKKMVPHSQKLSKLAQRFEHWSSPEQIRMLFDPNGLPRECGA